MNRKQVIQALKDLYQLDPAGPGWVESDDIEMAVYWAGQNGDGYVARHVITYTPGPGYLIHRRDAG